jgi:uncharacterized protein CbrC (UPF0167 family)
MTEYKTENGDQKQAVCNTDILEFLQSFREYGNTADQYDQLLVTLMRTGHCGLRRNRTNSCVITPISPIQKNKKID